MDKLRGMTTNEQDAPVLVERSRATVPGLFVIVVFGFLLATALLRRPAIEVWIPCLFGLGVLVGLGLVVRGLNRGLQLYTDKVRVRDAFGRVTVVPFAEIVRATLRRDGSAPAMLIVQTAEGQVHAWRVARHQPEHVQAIVALFGSRFGVPATDAPLGSDSGTAQHPLDPGASAWADITWTAPRSEGGSQRPRD